jgi:hypothetical protein
MRGKCKVCHRRCGREVMQRAGVCLGCRRVLDMLAACSVSRDGSRPPDLAARIRRYRWRAARRLPLFD